MIRNWEENHCMAFRTKMVAIVSMLGAGGASVLFAVQELWLKGLGIGLLSIGTIFVLRIKTCEDCAVEKLERREEQSDKAGRP